jgi:hypothetical protein
MYITNYNTTDHTKKRGQTTLPATTVPIHAANTT